jgi:hypothetical protein
MPDKTVGAAQVFHEIGASLGYAIPQVLRDARQVGLPRLVAVKQSPPLLGNCPNRSH